jgi:acyl-CoA reductase-like NAD-dependent aldehyde dehydrogenase
VAAAAAARLEVGVVAVNRRTDDVDLEAPFCGRRRAGNGQPEGGMYAYAAVTDLQAVYS